MKKEELIMKDFLELKEKGLLKAEFNTVGKTEFNNLEELCDVLSQSLIGIYNARNDLQESFDGLNFILDGMLNKHQAVYSVGTKDWEVIYNQELNDDQLSIALNKWNEYFNSNNQTIEELCNSVKHKIIDITSNVGCDIFNALRMLIDDTDIDGDVLLLSYGELKPRISFYKIDREV